MSRSPDSPTPDRGAHLLGVGLDGDDGHQRVTRGENMFLVGGSHETHERMQEHAIKLEEELQRRGTNLRECSAELAAETFREVVDKCQ